MYKLCKTEQSARRQRQLEDGLLQAILNQRYEDISISDLCANIQIPRKAFYRYFSSKDGALFALVDHTLMEFEQFQNSRSRGKSKPSVDLERYFVFWQKHKDLLMAMEKSHLIDLLLERTIAHALHDGMIPFPRISAESMQPMALTFVICGLFFMMLRWHREGFAQSTQDMVIAALDLLSKPLIPSVTE